MMATRKKAKKSVSRKTSTTAKKAVKKTSKKTTKKVSKKATKKTTKKVTKKSTAKAKAPVKATPAQLAKDLKLLKALTEDYLTEAAKLGRQHASINATLKKHALRVAKRYEEIEKLTKKLHTKKR